MATTPTTTDTSRDPRAGGKGAGGGRSERRGRDGGPEKEKSPYTERVVFINRV